MFAHEAARLIGVRTGRASGRVIVDVDVKHGAPGMAWFGRHGAELPRTRTHRTASGGLHLVFAAPEHVEIRSSQSRVAPGVDVRGEGGYAIWWPAAGCAVVDHVAPAAMPPWLVQAALPPPPPPRSYRPAASLHDAAGRLLALVRFVAAAPQGERNARLFWAACRCVEAALRGEMPTGAVAAALEQAALAAGLPQPEARRTITSAFRKAAAA